MRLTAMTDEAIAAAIGARVQELRLKKNLSQEEVAKEAGISRQTLINLLHGKGTLVNLVAVLRAISELERVTSLVQEVRPSPIQVMKMAGTRRVRATGMRTVKSMVNKGKTGAHVTPPIAKRREKDQW